MSKTTKTTLWIIVAIIVIGGIWYGVSRKPAPTPTVKEPIKIGTILPLTGDFAALGEEVKRGIEIGVEEAKNSGVALNVVYEDDQSLSPTALVNAANKLINMDKVNVGLTMIVEESRSITPIFNKNKTPLMVLWDSNKFIKEAGEYVFSNGFSTEKAGEIMARFAYSKLNLKKTAMISHIDPWANIISDSFENEFKKLGGTIVYKETLQPTETDYKTVITKIKNSGADSVYFPLVPPNSALFLKQAHEMNLNLPLLTGDALIQDVIDAAGKAAEGVYFTNIYTEPGEASMLTKKYKNRYGKEPLDVTLISFGYNGIMKIVEAIQREKPGESLQQALVSIFGEGRSVERAEKIYQVVNGKPVEISH